MPPLIRYYAPLLPLFSLTLAGCRFSTLYAADVIFHACLRRYAICGYAMFTPIRHFRCLMLPLLMMPSYDYIITPYAFFTCLRSLPLRFFLPPCCYLRDRAADADYAAAAFIDVLMLTLLATCLLTRRHKIIMLMPRVAAMLAYATAMPPAPHAALLLR